MSVYRTTGPLVLVLSCCSSNDVNDISQDKDSGAGQIGPRQMNLVLIVDASSKGSGEPVHLRSLARTSAAHAYKQRVNRNLQTESQIPGPSGWLGMHS